MVIQTDSESQKQERDSCMKCACVLAVLTIGVSFIAFVIGAVAITKSQPVYAFPYCIGGAMIAGIFTCVSSFVQYRHYNIYSNNKEDVTGEDAQKWSRQLCRLCPFVCTSLILGVVFSGVWGMVQATAEKKDPDSEGLARTNLQYAIASFVLVLILLVLQMILYCVCHGFKATYSIEHLVQGDDEFYIPANSYTYRPRRIHGESANEYETRVNYSNAARRNQPSTVDTQAGRNLSRLTARGAYVTDPSEINNPRSHINEGGRRPVTSSIPIPELYYGVGIEPTAPPSETVNVHESPPRYEELAESRLPTYQEELAESRRLPTNQEELAENRLPTYQEVIETGAYYIAHL